MDARERFFAGSNVSSSPRDERRELVESLDDEVVATRHFAYLRGPRERAQTLTLKGMNGNACSLEWSWAPDIVYVPGHDVPLVLVFSSRGFKVEIVGQGLGDLASYLHQRRVVWIQAEDRMHAFSRNAGNGHEQAAVVEEIRVVRLAEGEDLTLLQSALESSGTI
jgi:hypothetical protein